MIDKKQEESRMIRNATEVFLRSGGKIEKLPTIKAINSFSMDVFKERVDVFSHNMSLYEAPVNGSKDSKNEKISTRLKPDNPDIYRHPWQKTFLSKASSSK